MLRVPTWLRERGNSSCEGLCLRDITIMVAARVLWLGVGCFCPLQKNYGPLEGASTQPAVHISGSPTPTPGGPPAMEAESSQESNQHLDVYLYSTKAAPRERRALTTPRSIPQVPLSSLQRIFNLPGHRLHANCAHNGKWVREKGYHCGDMELPFYRYMVLMGMWEGITALRQPLVWLAWNNQGFSPFQILN